MLHCIHLLLSMIPLSKGQPALFDWFRHQHALLAIVRLRKAVSCHAKRHCFSVHLQDSRMLFFCRWKALARFDRTTHRYCEKPWIPYLGFPESHAMVSLKLSIIVSHFSWFICKPILNTPNMVTGIQGDGPRRPRLAFFHPMKFQFQDGYSMFNPHFTWSNWSTWSTPPSKVFNC